MALEKIKMILSNQFDVEEDRIEPETNLTEDLGADSLDVADLLSHLSAEFGVDIESEPIESFKTVEDLVKFIENKTKK